MIFGMKIIIEILLLIEKRKPLIFKLKMLIKSDRIMIIKAHAISMIFYFLTLNLILSDLKFKYDQFDHL